MPESLVGTKVGPYRIMDMLGKGGMGEVYAAFDERLGRKIALKTIRAENRLDLESRGRFLREARVLSQLDHPNICKIFDYLEGAEADFLVLELIEGAKLSTAIRAGLDPSRTLSLARQLAEVLVAAHGQGIVHRDLKPDNVMLTEAGAVKVLDFGLSRPAADERTLRLAADSARIGQPGPAPQPPPAAASGEALTSLGTVLGTVGYMSPEQARGEAVTTASDIYSLGLVLQELFTGKPPFPAGGSDPMQRIELARRGETLPLAGLDPDLTALVNRMKALEPAQRPTAIEARDRLAWIAAKPARRRSRALLAAAFAALALFSAASAWQAVRVGRERDRANRESDTAKRTLGLLTSMFEIADPATGRGPTVSAREIVAQGVTRLREIDGQPALRASLAGTLGILEQRLGDFAASRKLLEESVALRRSQAPVDEPALASALRDLGNVAVDEGRFAEAQSLYAEALAIQERTSGRDSLAVAETLARLAHSYAVAWQVQPQAEKMAEAEAAARRALAIREKALGSFHPLVADSLLTIADIERSVGLLDEAAADGRLALAAAERAFGSDSVRLVSYLNAMAGVFWQKGDPAGAQPFMARMAAIDEKAYGPDHPVVASDCANQALLLRAQGKAAEAEALFRRSLAIREKSLGPRHYLVADSLNKLAVSAMERQDFAAAESLLARALEIASEALGQTSQGALDVHYNLVANAALGGRRALALDRLEAAMRAGLVDPEIAADPDLASLRGDPRFEAVAVAMRRRAGTPDAPR